VQVKRNGRSLLSFYTIYTYPLSNIGICYVYSCINVVVAIPNCSFPFTYNGGLYYGCITGMTGVSTDDQPFACINVNATSVVCESPGWICFKSIYVVNAGIPVSYPGKLMYTDADDIQWESKVAS